MAAGVIIKTEERRQHEEAVMRFLACRAAGRQHREKQRKLSQPEAAR